MTRRQVRQASFAVRIVRRRGGDAAIVYRRSLTKHRQELLKRIAAISPLAFTVGAPLLKEAVRACEGSAAKLTSGPYHPLDADWGARVACYAVLAHGLRNADRLSRAAKNLREADGPEVAWWLGLMNNGQGKRAVRALRILVEAVK